MKTVQKDLPGRSETGDGLTPKQESAAVALAGGATFDEAAKASGAGVSTVKDWSATVPAFKARVADLRGEMTERVFGLIVDAMAEAVGTMVGLMKSKNESMRHKAAESMMTHYANAVEVRDLKTRLEMLEGNR